MNLLQALVLGLVQGATEFIPISSSGHLVLVPWLFNWEEAPLAFNTTVHWGTLVAVVAVFWRDLAALLRAAICELQIASDRLGRRILGGSFSRAESLKLETSNPQFETHPSRLAWAIVLASVPAALAGFLFEDFFEDLFGRPTAAAGLLLVTAAILTLSERLGRRERSLVDIGWLDALFIGLAQALAIMPGISRSGTTIAAGLTRGIRREAAARFSFLLSTPVILGAGLFKLLDLAGEGGLATLTGPLVLGFVTAAVSGYVCIRWLLTYLARRPLYVFAIYCGAFGLFNLIVAWMRG